MTKERPRRRNHGLDAAALLVLDQLAGDPNTERLFAEHPELTRDDVSAALGYARDVLARSNPAKAARDRRFRRMLAVAQRNPDVDGDALLEQLEREDAIRRTQVGT